MKNSKIKAGCNGNNGTGCNVTKYVLPQGGPAPKIGDTPKPKPKPGKTQK